jgi:hypothetical protein
MLCFQFVGDESSQVILCEETIQYSAYRKDGVRAGANVVIRYRPSGKPYVYAIHRRAFGHLRIASSETWVSEESGFPYSFIFSNICKERLRRRPDGSFGLRAQGLASEEERLEILPNQDAPDFAAVEEMTAGSDLDPEAPFSLIRLGPFPQREGLFLLRFEFSISGTSFTDLIPEYHDTAARLYRVYGPDHIMREISLVDLPQALSQDAERYARYKARFDAFSPQSLLVPRLYSIIAVDNPNCNPARLHCIDITADLRDLTSKIDVSLYQHPYFQRQKIDGRLHWFLSDKPNRGFYLQLLGPMALTDVVMPTVENVA